MQACGAQFTFHQLVPRARDRWGRRCRVRAALGKHMSVPDGLPHGGQGPPWPPEWMQDAKCTDTHSPHPPYLVQGIWALSASKPPGCCKKCSLRVNDEIRAPYLLILVPFCHIREAWWHYFCHESNFQSSVVTSWRTGLGRSREAVNMPSPQHPCPEACQDDLKGLIFLREICVCDSH